MKTFSGIPRTVEEAVEQVLSAWSKDEIASFYELEVNDLFDLRNSLGADIRNVFSLWYGNDELLNDCDQYLTRNKEFYDQVIWKKEEKVQGKKRIADTLDFLPNIGNNNEEEEDDEEEIKEEDIDFLLPPVDESIKSTIPGETIPIDPFIASQIIIFAVWNHLQVHGPIL